ncbi:MAG TPA: indole-3-glycerol-phosphate synthase TrpC, partial [Dehalococcoidia bacterium]|nr:indole-3-glycerol-phosphate synthase TrpC [Dehalococcoidia bacterium]
SLLALTSELGLAAVVEVHDEREVERALAAGAQIIGINNRDLRTFATSLEVTELLRPQIPAGPIVISESGIHRTADIERLAAAGIDAILVGEALMRSGDVGQSVREFSNVPARAVK